MLTRAPPEALVLNSAGDRGFRARGACAAEARTRVLLHRRVLLLDSDVEHIIVQELRAGENGENATERAHRRKRKESPSEKVERRAGPQGSRARRERGVRGGAAEAFFGPARRRSARPASPVSSGWQCWDRGVMTAPWPCHHCERERRPSATTTAVVAVKFYARLPGHRTGESRAQITWLCAKGQEDRKGLAVPEDRWSPASFNGPIFAHREEKEGRV